MKSVGIIGAGSFGLFIAEKLSDYCHVKLYSRSGLSTKWTASLEKAGQCNYVIPCIPLEAYQSVLKNLSKVIHSETVIIDVCSVKQKPVQVIRNVLPNHRIVATHPLFGPESAKDSLTGQVLVLCPDVSDRTHLKYIELFANKINLRVVTMSSEEHDSEMAVVQGLTFFIARVLKEIGLHHQKLETPSFRRLLHLAELEQHHSESLFGTIQAGNSKVREVRKKFINEAIRIDKTLNN